jgi:hypothetical protein
MISACASVGANVGNGGEVNVAVGVIVRASAGDIVTVGIILLVCVAVYVFAGKDKVTCDGSISGVIVDMTIDLVVTMGELVVALGDEEQLPARNMHARRRHIKAILGFMIVPLAIIILCRVDPLSHIDIHKFGSLGPTS